MGKFNLGDRVVDGDGDIGRVVGTNRINVAWDNKSTPFAEGWVENEFELYEERAFNEGDFVRVKDSVGSFGGNVGLIFQDDGDPENICPYHVALYDKDETEQMFSDYELEAWVPRIGEHVFELNNDDAVRGTVYHVDGTTVRVLWDTYPHGQEWYVSELEPAEYDSDEYFKVGDTVHYSNPFFVGTQSATVLDIHGNLLNVKFDNSDLPSGNYDSNFFERAAA